MSNNDLYCSKCKSHHHPADCPLDTAEIMPDKKENFCFAPMQKNYMKEASKLLPKKKRVHSDYRHSLMVRADVGGYNFAIDDCTPIVADLLRQIDELKARG